MRFLTLVVLILLLLTLSLACERQYAEPAPEPEKPIFIDSIRKPFPPLISQDGTSVLVPDTLLQ